MDKVLFDIATYQSHNYYVKVLFDQGYYNAKVLFDLHTQPTRSFYNVKLKVLFDTVTTFKPQLLHPGSL